MPCLIRCQNVTCPERNAARGRPGDDHLRLVLRPEARVSFVITTSNLEPLRRPLETAQYCSHEYQKPLRRHEFRVSMSGKGNCHDNSAVEAFFQTIKAEMIWRRPWHRRTDAELAIFRYINGFYNPRRRHSALGWKSPVAFERKVAETSTEGGTKTGEVQFASFFEAELLVGSYCISSF